MLAAGRFCNVWREHDKTSALILGILRRHKSQVRPALAVGLRLINRYATLLDFRHGEPLRQELGRLVSVGINTNAYRINTPLGLNNKAGVNVLLDRVEGAQEALALLTGEAASFRDLQAQTHQLLGGMSSFIVYQALLDLRDLDMLRAADDWAYPGPGCLRGLWRLDGRVAPGHWLGHNFRNPEREFRGRDIQAELIALSTELRQATGWSRWSIHETEGWLCEWDKYERLRDKIILLNPLDLSPVQQ